MVLAGVSPRIHDAMDLVGFIPLFEFFDDAAQAVGSF
jgi:hypothetical protein